MFPHAGLLKLPHLISGCSERLDLAPPLLTKGTKAMHQQEGWRLGLRHLSLCCTAGGLRITAVCITATCVPMQPVLAVFAQPEAFTDLP